MSNVKNGKEDLEYQTGIFVVPLIFKKINKTPL